MRQNTDKLTAVEILFKLNGRFRKNGKSLEINILISKTDLSGVKTNAS